MNRQLHDLMVAQYATPKVSGDGLVSWDKGVKCVMPGVKLLGAAEQGGTPTPDTPIMPVCNDGVYRSTSPDGTWDGGHATAPELWAIPGTDIRDEWDAQTGKGIRRVKKLVLDGTETWVRTTVGYGTDDPFQGFALTSGFADISTEIICSHFPYSSNDNQPNVCLQRRTYGKYQVRITVSTEIVPNKSVSEWKSYLAAQYAAGTPVTVICVPAEPEPFYFAPARLTMPNGPGQIIQLSGSVPECPIEVNYLTHAGGSK